MTRRGGLIPLFIVELGHEKEMGFGEVVEPLHPDILHTVKNTGKVVRGKVGGIDDPATSKGPPARHLTNA